MDGGGTAVLGGAGGGPPGDPNKGHGGGLPRGPLDVGAEEEDEDEESEEEGPDELAPWIDIVNNRDRYAIQWFSAPADATVSQSPWASGRMMLWCRNRPKRCNRCGFQGYMGGGLGCVSPQCQVAQQQAFIDNSWSQGNHPAVIYPTVVDLDTMKSMQIAIDPDDDAQVQVLDAPRPTKRHKKNRGQARGRSSGIDGFSSSDSPQLWDRCQRSGGVGGSGGGVGVPRTKSMGVYHQ